MKRYSPTLIGIFVLGALVLAVAGILGFGAQAWWRESQKAVLFFDESVYGLERGSAVRLMGVKVGQVIDIRVRYTGKNKTRVEVICEIDRNPAAHDGRLGDLRDPATLEQMVADGLQARLDLIGITGLLFVEMDYFGVPPEKALALEHPDYVAVPTVGSVLTGVTDNLAEIARQLGDIDFAALGESARRLLETATTSLEEARFDELFDRMHTAMAGVQALLDSGQLQQTLRAAEQSFADVSRLAQRVEEQVQPAVAEVSMSSEQFRKTLENAEETLSAIRDLFGPRMNLGYQLGETLTTIEEAARSVERLAEFLERNPQAILRGTTAPER